MALRTWQRRALAVLIGTGVALIALELALQAVALALWAGGGPSARGAADGDVVLAIGDSFTYGLGASGSDASYPAVLAERLAGDPGGVRVVNAGVPGNSTVDVAARLDALLAAHRPRVVVLLCGYNDLVKATRPLTAADFRSADGDGFPLRCRTLALLRRIAGALGDGPLGALDRDALLGAWSDGRVDVAFAADGTCTVGGVGAPFTIAGDRLTIGATPAQIGYRARIVGDALVMTPLDATGEGLELRRAAPSAGPAAGSTAPTQRMIDRLAGLAPLEAAAVRAACDQLDAVAAPGESELWWRLIASALGGVEVARVTATLESGASRLAADDPWRAGLLRGLGLLAMPRDPARGLEHFVAAAAVDGRVDGIAVQLAQNFPGAELASLDRALAGAAVPADRAARIRAELAPRLAGDAPLVATIAANLVHLVARCRDAGAAVVLLSYPEVHPVLHNAARDAARDAGVPFVDVAAAFATELAVAPDRELFVSDRHCNDAGYRLLAETAAPAVRAALAAGR